MLAVALCLLAASPDPAAAPPPAAIASIDEGAVAEAVEAVLAHGKSAVRVAVPPISDKDDARKKAVELAVVRAILDRRREEAVTPAYLRAKLNAQAEAQATGALVDALKPFACDHVLLGSVVDEGGKAVLHLKLIYSESGEVLGEESAELGAGEVTSASAGNVRATTEKLAEQIAYAVESTGENVHTHRIAVSPLAAEGAAKESRLDQFTQQELIRALKQRGFLVVERAQLAAALDQLALGQVVADDSAPKIGKMLGAQSLLVGSVADGGAVFLVNLRLLSAETGAVLGAASAQLPRNDVVTMAQVETRTPFEAGVRSAVAPGWGQSFNGQGGKALAFGITGYTALAATAGLAIGGIVEQVHYSDISYFEKLPPAQASSEAAGARTTFTNLYIATAVAGGAFVTVWTLGVVDAIVSAPKD